MNIPVKQEHAVHVNSDFDLLCVCVHPTRFAIDWRPAQRLLVFLKTASVVCHLEVGEGYPSGGSAKLVAVRKDNHDLDITTLQVSASVSQGVALCWCLDALGTTCVCVCLGCVLLSFTHTKAQPTETKL